MSRKIFRAIADSTHTTAVIETASSGGGQWGSPVRLSTVRMANEDIGELHDTRINGNPKVESICWQKVNGQRTGPRSNYAKVLNGMLDELPDHVSYPVLDTGLIPEAKREDIAAVIDPFKERLAVESRHAVLDKATVGGWSPADMSGSHLLPKPQEGEATPVQRQVRRL